MSRIKIEEQVKETFGVDLKDYRDEDAAESLLELITFPSTAIRFMLVGLVIGLIFYILGFFVIDLSSVEYVVYGIFGLIGNLFFTTFYTLYRFIGKIKDDLVRVIKYSFGVLGSITKSHQVKKNLNKDNVGLLFKGVLLGVIAPIVTDKVGDKIPLVGATIASMVTKMFEKVSNIDLLSYNKEVKDEKEVIELDNNEALSMKLETVVSNSLSVIQRPLKYIWIVSLVFNTLFIYLIN